MRKFMSWVGILVLTGIGASLLYTYGQLHTVYVENKSLGTFKAPKNIFFQINDSKEGKVNQNRRGQMTAKGPVHEFILKYRDEQGQEQVVKKTLNLKLNRSAIISVEALILGKEIWYKYE